MTANVLLDCKNIWKLYGAKADSILINNANPDIDTLRAEGVIGAVRAVNVQIMQGEIFVIMGLSGSGKSTLVRCLSRLVEPTTGAINFDGIDLLRATDNELIEIRRKKMGMVFQQFALLPHLTTMENVAFPLDVPCRISMVRFPAPSASTKTDFRTKGVSASNSRAGKKPLDP